MTQQIQINKGIISIKLDGLEPVAIERYRASIHQLMIRGVFEIKNGKVILHFDSNKELRQIDVHFTPWRK